VAVTDRAHSIEGAEQGGVPFDLVITHWGDGAARTSDGSSCSTAVGLLTAMRTGDLRCPVIVFASAVDADERKNVILRLGALAYCFSFSALYRTIEAVRHPYGWIRYGGWAGCSRCFDALVQGRVGGLIRESLRKGEPDHGFKAGGGHIHTPILLASQCPAWFTPQPSALSIAVILR